MKKGYIHIAILIDASGSMDIIRDDVIKNFNEFIESHQHDSNTSLSVTSFNLNCKEMFRTSIASDTTKLSKANYIPKGPTALFDSIVSTMEKEGEFLCYKPEHLRPEKVIFVIITDGEENSSTCNNLDRVKEKIKHQIEKYNWEFLYIGAGIDAYTSATNIGITNTVNVEKSAMGLKACSKSIDRTITSFRK